MKIISTAVLVALFSVSQARFLDISVAGRQLDANLTNTQTVAQTYGSGFSNDYNCGRCIGLGHTYCIRKAEQTMTNGYQQGSTDQKCVQSGSTTDTNLFGDGGWSCSNAFVDRVYSKYTCQINTAQCGATNSTVLATTASTAAFSVSNLQIGQVCMYKVQAMCGAPAFLPTGDLTKAEIEYVEYRDNEVNQTGTNTVFTTGQPSNSNTKKQAQPAIGLPRRDHYFFGDIGGNAVAAGGNLTAYTNVATNGAIWGRSGRYDEIAGSRKVYGNPTQSLMSMGNLTDQAQPDCTNRTMIIAVTSTMDGATIGLAISAVDFYRPPVVATPASGASFISMTFAAVLGLVSLAFF